MKELKYKEWYPTYCVKPTDLEEFFCQEYGFNTYYLDAMEEKSRGDYLVFYVTQDDEIDHAEWLLLKEMYDKKIPIHYSTHLLLSNLCTLGKVPSGTYIIGI